MTTSVVGGLATLAPGAISNAVPVLSTVQDKNFMLRATDDAVPGVLGLIDGFNDFGPTAFFESSLAGGADVSLTLPPPTVGFDGSGAATSGAS